MTVEKIYRGLTEGLRDIYEPREADNIADWVFETISGLKRLERSANKEKQLSEDVIRKLNNALERLLKHEPVQYILGESWFYKRKFIVNKHVLIPRPETEELVEAIKNEELRMKNEELKLIDIGTGSGCIAISIKKELPEAEVTAIDISAEALKVATTNAEDLKAEVIFKQRDFLNEDDWKELPEYDIIVSNPPYIPSAEKDTLSRNVAEHEPHLALFVANDDPFIFYKKIAAFSIEHLKNGGSIYVEVHEDYAKNVMEIFLNSDLKKVTIVKDIYGKERIVKAVK